MYYLTAHAFKIQNSSQVYIICQFTHSSLKLRASSKGWNFITPYSGNEDDNDSEFSEDSDSEDSNSEDSDSEDSDSEDSEPDMDLVNEYYKSNPKAGPAQKFVCNNSIDKNDTLEESEENEITEKSIHEKKKIEPIHQKKKLEYKEQNESKERSESTEQNETIEQNDSIDQNDTLEESEEKQIIENPIHEKKKIVPIHEKKKLEYIEQNESKEQSESTEQNNSIDQKGDGLVNLKRSSRNRKMFIAADFLNTSKPPSPFKSPTKPTRTCQSANYKDKFENQNEIIEKPIHEEKKIEPIDEKKKLEYLEQNESNEQSESTEKNETIEQNDSIDQIQLDTHIESGLVEKGQKTFSCCYCDKIFSQKSSLKEF